jgi:hypothetical protein
MKRLIVGMVFLLTGCASMVTEQRAAKLDTEVRAIQHDFSALSATFTPEQEEKYARAKAIQDDAMFQEFYASLDAHQQATMQGLLDRADQAVQEQQSIEETVRRDMATRYWTRNRIGVRGIMLAAGGGAI